MSMGPVLHSFAYGLDFVRELVADVPAEKFAERPAGAKNHPAWTIGHLTFVSQMLGGVVGVAEWLPGEWATIFGPGSVPGEGREYPAKEVLLAALREAQGRVSAAVEGLSAAKLDEPFPDPAYRDVFPTIRHALTQVMVGHTGYHTGQLVLWRKAMGYAPLGRSYE